MNEQHQRNTTSTRDADVAIAMVKARSLGVAPDPYETATFVERLRGYDRDSYARVFGEPDLTPLPGGFRNVRIRDGRDDAVIRTYWWLDSSGADLPVTAGGRESFLTEQPTASNVIGCVLWGLLFEEVTAWRGTRDVSVAGTGMLELVVDIDTRVRTLDLDGKPWPEPLLAKFRRNAPARADR